MVTILVIYLFFIFTLFGIVAILIKVNLKKDSWDVDKMYYDEDGNHRYYERSLIEKLYYKRKHPDYGPIRSFRKLFSYKRN